MDIGTGLLTAALVVLLAFAALGVGKMVVHRNQCPAGTVYLGRSDACVVGTRPWDK
jgi:hypothetical protein